MFDFWYELPPILRVVFGLFLIGIALVIFLATDGRRIAIGLGVVGIVFVLASGAGSNKDGYNF